MFVGGVVVEDQVYIQGCGDGFVDAFKKAEKLLMPVARLALGSTFPWYYCVINVGYRRTGNGRVGGAVSVPG